MGTEPNCSLHLKGGKFLKYVFMTQRNHEVVVSIFIVVRYKSKDESRFRLTE